MQLDSLIKKYVIQLHEKGIDTVCIYQNYCVGCSSVWIKEEDKCFYGGLFIPTYILWLEKGQTFMTKKDNCFDYSIAKISNDSFWQFYLANKDTIKKEKIKIPQFFETRKGKKHLYSTLIDHSWVQSLTIIVKQDTTYKELDDFYFTKEVGGNQLNINYEYNTHTFLKKFQFLVDKTVEVEMIRNKMTKIRRVN